jgi:tRNA-2-methylthio-N6-dimethylallyladenosine synthase
MTDELIDTMAELPTICEHLNLPVQAGDDDVLRRMRRTYTADLWRDRIAYARERIPGLTVATDIIVGFPGETAEQFDNTLRLLEDVGCDKVHVAMYSPRPGTLSSRWDDDIAPEEKHRRHQAVEKLQERLLSARNAARLGEEHEVLVDSRQKGRWSGRTRGNLLVHIDSDDDLLGQFVAVTITESSPWYLIARETHARRREPAMISTS